MSEHAVALTHEAPRELALACPCCGAPLPAAVESLRCASCALRFARESGIWRFLPPERDLALRRFITEYRFVRRAEGWGSGGPDYYRALPFRDLTGRFEAIWRIRAASFATFLRRVVAPLERDRGRPLAALDLGAGNGWLSHRLAERGHAVVAVDLSDDPRDGLGAHVHYPTRFTPVLADFDHLPLAGRQADLVVFNASLHYSPDAAATLAEALRVLRGDGVVAIVDSPLYFNPTNGTRMLREKPRPPLEVGPGGTTVAAEGFLSRRRLRELAAALEVRTEVVRPSRWWVMRGRALLASVRGRRETATFPVIVVRRSDVGSRRAASGGARAAR